jgi:hypothetical protein
MTPLKKFAIAGVCLVLCLAVAVHTLCVGDSLSPNWELLASLLALAPLAMSFSGGPSLRDALLKATRALPAAASSTVAQATGFDLMVSAAGDVLAQMELLVSAPAVNTTMAPDTRTFTYNIIASASSNLGTPTIISQNLIVQTGAGGAGAAAATARYRIPTDLGARGFRYVGLQIVSGASTTDASAVSATAELLF